jgi:hypothetical protein
VILQTSSGFKAGIALAGYRSLQDAVWNFLGKPWDAPEIAITPRAFTRALSQPLRLILKEQVAALSRESVDAVILAVVQQAKLTLPKSASHPEEWVSLVRQELADNLGAHIVRPMLSFLELSPSHVEAPVHQGCPLSVDLRICERAHTVTWLRLPKYGVDTI